MPHIVLLLQKLDLLCGARRSILARISRIRPISFRSAIIFKITAMMLYVGITCIVPLLILSDFGETTEIGRHFAEYHHIIINAAVILLFILGLFVGANLIYELNLGENERLLTYPIVMDDLVRYRAIDVLIVAMKFCLYIVFPSMILVFLALGCSTIWTIALSILSTIFGLVAYFVGINVLLIIAKWLSHRGPERIFISIFLVLIMLFAITIRMFKDGFFGTEYSTAWLWLDQQLALISYSSFLDNMVLLPYGLLQYGLGLALGAVLFRLFWKVSLSSIGYSYERIHVQADDITAKKKKYTARWSITNLNRYLRFLPLYPRTLLIKDILVLIRRPYLLIKIFVFLAVVVLAVNWRHSLVANPLLFALYFSSSFIVSRLFINIIGQEQGNILVIKQLSPSIFRYLAARVKIAVSISLLLFLPLFCVLVGISVDITLLGAVLRSPLLLLNIILTSVLVTAYSAAFAEFRVDKLEKHRLGIHPAAMLVYWSFGTLMPLFFYKLDMALLTNRVGSISIVLIILIGVFLMVSTIVFSLLGIRRIKYCVQ